MELSCLSGPDSIAKIGEGTYGEAFKAGNTVCKIVPIDGDIKVNGEVQKVHFVTIYPFLLRLWASELSVSKVGRL